MSLFEDFKKSLEINEISYNKVKAYHEKAKEFNRSSVEKTKKEHHEDFEKDGSAKTYRNVRLRKGVGNAVSKLNGTARVPATEETILEKLTKKEWEGSKADYEVDKRLGYKEDSKAGEKADDEMVDGINALSKDIKDDNDKSDVKKDKRHPKVEESISDNRKLSKKEWFEKNRNWGESISEEPLDEISKAKLNSYLEKNDRVREFHADAADKALVKSTNSYFKKEPEERRAEFKKNARAHMDKYNKRTAGWILAVNKTHNRSEPKYRVRVPATEEVEQIDELEKKILKSYITKAQRNAIGSQRTADSAVHKSGEGFVDEKKWADKQVSKRLSGISTAKKKLDKSQVTMKPYDRGWHPDMKQGMFTAEEIENLDERNKENLAKKKQVIPPNKREKNSMSTFDPREALKRARQVKEEVDILESLMDDLITSDVEITEENLGYIIDILDESNTLSSKKGVDDETKKKIEDAISSGKIKRIESNKGKYRPFVGFSNRMTFKGGHQKPLKY